MDAMDQDLSQSLDPQQRLKMAEELLAKMDYHVKVADEKVSVLFGATALLAAALTFNAGDEFSRILGGGGAAGPQLAPVGWLELIVRAILFATVAAAVVFAILALVPRLRVRNVQPSIFFFGRIAAMDADDFQREFFALDPDTATRHILRQAYVAADIVTVKYRWTRRAGNAFALAIGLLVAAQIIALLG